MRHFIIVNHFPVQDTILNGRMALQLFKQILIEIHKFLILALLISAIQIEFAFLVVNLSALAVIFVFIQEIFVLHFVEKFLAFFLNYSSYLWSVKVWPSLGSWGFLPGFFLPRFSQIHCKQFDLGLLLPDDGGLKEPFFQRPLFVCSVAKFELRN